MQRLADFVARHPRWVVLGWVVFTVVLAIAAQTAGGVLTDAFSLPGAESQRAQDVLAAEFPEQSGVEVKAVFHTPDGQVSGPGVPESIAAFRRGAALIEDVNAVSDPWTSPGDISRDGRTALVRVQYGRLGRELDEEHVQALLDLAEAPRPAGLVLEFSGQPVRELETQETRISELVGIGFALVVLLLAFGSVIAAGMPIITALVGLAIGTILILIAAAQLDIVTLAPLFGAMLGIGVGIDYALFVISRFREQLAAGYDVPDAVRISVLTAGRAVSFAGIIVVVALLGLFFIGIPLVANLGLSAALVVLMEMLIAITLLPALLRMVGRRIDRFSIPGLRYAAGGERGRWYRFSRRVERRPWLWLTGATLLLLAITAPLLDMQLGVADDGNVPERYTTRRAYDLIAEAFGPGVNAALIAVSEHRSPAAAQELEQIRASLASLEGVAAVPPPRVNDARTAAVFVIVPTAEPQAPETHELVRRLRNQSVPAAIGAIQTETAIYIAGLTALLEDLRERMMQRMPIFFSVVIGVSVLLLMMAFRSVLVPLKAAVMNMLAISASLGLLVLIFQWGWGLSLVGLDKTGPVESFLPMFMFAILFGLSMDYEVFLLSRVRERWVQTGDSAESVAHGIGASARVITAAAAILAVVFLSFAVFGEEHAVKQFGIGMAFAIIVDATVVRLVLVPAFMQLAGRANWWMPQWLDRLLPNVSIDPPPQTLAPPPVREAPAPAPAAAQPVLSWPLPSAPEPETQPSAPQPAPPAAEPDPEPPPAEPTPTLRGLVSWAALGALTACAFTIGLLLGSAWAGARTPTDDPNR